jgi:hypothetical protein
MGVGTYLGYIGGALAVVAGAVSTITLKPIALDEDITDHSSRIALG